MPAQMSLPAAKHLNRGLFSDYYLDHIVPTLPDYQSEQLHAQARAVRDDLRALLEALRPESLDEAQLEDGWIKPVLARLGHHWSVQIKIRYRDRGHRKPDYVFTATADDASAFMSLYGRKCTRGFHPKWARGFRRNCTSEVHPERAR